METARKQLLAAGINVTPQRLAIAEVLFVGHQHLSADQVFEKVRQKSGSVSRATVYNTLNLFAEKGLIREIFVDASRVFYDTNLQPHYHCYNVDTGALTDMEDDAIEAYFSRELPGGTKLVGVDVVVRVSNIS